MEQTTRFSRLKIKFFRSNFGGKLKSVETWFGSSLIWSSEEEKSEIECPPTPRRPN
jgi:hypothetical protein